MESTPIYDPVEPPAAADAIMSDGGLMYLDQHMLAQQASLLASKSTSNPLCVVSSP